MTDLIQTIARAIEQANSGDVGLETSDDFARAALTAINEAGLVIVPRDTQAALEDAVYVIRNVTCESEWSKRNGWRDPDADVDEDLRCWADHWRSSHESVSEIAARQDAATTTGETGNG